jgi:hypothetical protein
MNEHWQFHRQRRRGFPEESRGTIKTWDPMHMKWMHDGGEEFHKTFVDARLSVKCFSGPPILAFRPAFA